MVFIMIIVSCTVKETPVSVYNPSMEIMENGRPAGWDSTWWDTPATHLVSGEAHEGNYSLCISSVTPSRGAWSSRVRLEPFTTYRMHAWLKTENITATTGKGATFMIRGTFDAEPEYFTGTHDWTKVEYVFHTGWDDSMVAALLFGADGESTGTVWLDDLTIEMIDQVEKKPRVEIDLTRMGAPMESYIYGQFIEHLGRCIYGGIWAEMLDDRKFYYIPGTDDSPWNITGMGTAVEMNSKHSFAGRNAPVIVTGPEGGGIEQRSVGIREGVDCEGRIVVKNISGPGKMQMILKWGEAPGERSTVNILCPGSGFQTYAFTLTPGATTLEGSFEIRLPGDAAMSVAALSLMPADNVDGFRADVLRLLREMKAPVYRWPGGNFVSGYDWRDGLGDPDRRPTRKNPAWQGIEPNDVGIHEFLRFCELVNAEPYIAVNAGLGNVQLDTDEVEYVNGSQDTPMGRLRATNGHPQPYHVRFWSVGNEMYGNWQLGHMPPMEFTRKHNEMADAMRLADSTITIIGVGDLGEWDRAMLTHCADNIDLISEHFYCQDWHGGGLISHVRQIPDAIREKADSHRLYRKQIPGMAEKDIKICMDEWNYWYGPHVFGELGTRYFLRDGLGIAAGIHEYARQSDIIFMANYAQTVNVIGCIKTNDITASFETTGLVLMLYRNKFGVIPLAMDESFRPLDVAATLTAGRDTLCLGIVNPTNRSWSLPLKKHGFRINGLTEVFTITGPGEMAYNEPGMEPQVTISGPTMRKTGRRIEVAPVSIVLCRIPVRNK